MTKAEIEAAFRLLPIHPDGFSSLGFQFDGAFFVDNAFQWVFPLHGDGDCWT